LQPSRSAACYGTGRMPASEHAWAAGASQGLAPGTDGAAEGRFYLPSTVYTLATARCSAQRRPAFVFLAADFAAFLAVVFALLAGRLGPGRDSRRVGMARRRCARTDRLPVTASRPRAARLGGVRSFSSWVRTSPPSWQWC